MTVAREAFVLPALFLTVALLGGLRVAERVVLAPPPLFALVFSVLVLGLLVRCGALAPGRLVHAARPLPANLNGLIVIVALFFASAQVFTLITPESGLPRILVILFFLALIANTFAASPDHIRVLRSLLVILGSGFVVKFIVLATLSSPADTVLSRALRLVFEGATLGGVTQDVLHPATGYVGFCTLLMYCSGLVLLPGRGPSAIKRLPRKCG